MVPRVQRPTARVKRWANNRKRIKSVDESKTEIQGRRCFPQPGGPRGIFWTARRESRPTVADSGFRMADTSPRPSPQGGEGVRRGPAVRGPPDETCGTDALRVSPFRAAEHRSPFRVLPTPGARQVIAEADGTMICTVTPLFRTLIKTPFCRFTVSSFGVRTAGKVVRNLYAITVLR